MIQATKYCVSLISHPASVFPIFRVPQFHSHHPARSSTQAKSPPPPTPLPCPRGMILVHQTRPTRAVSSRPRRWADVAGPSGPRDGRAGDHGFGWQPQSAGTGGKPGGNRRTDGYRLWDHKLVKATCTAGLVISGAWSSTPGVVGANVDRRRGSSAHLWSLDPPANKRPARLSRSPQILCLSFRRVLGAVYYGR